MGHYVDQVKNAYNTDWTAGKEALSNNVISMYNTIKSIIEENDFPSKAEEKWTPMMESIKSNAEKLNTDIETKYNEMINRAKQFDDWYTELKELEGNPGGEAGLQFAIDKGFGRWVGTYSTRTSSDGAERTDKLYRWTAYKSVSIDTDGYIKIDMCRHEMKKRVEVDCGLTFNSIVYDKEISSTSVVVRNAEDAGRFGKSGISGDKLTTDGNGDGNSTFNSGSGSGSGHSF